METFDDDPDMPRGELGGTAARRATTSWSRSTPGEYLWICHFQPGSIKVSAGDQIAEGQVIGKVGNSGNTSEPHVHIHLQDSNDADFAEGIPLEFHHYRVNGKHVDGGIPTGGIKADWTFAGQVVENVPVPNNPPTSPPATSTSSPSS